jgi:hypothetical protein
MVTCLMRKSWDRRQAPIISDHSPDTAWDVTFHRGGIPKAFVP